MRTSFLALFLLAACATAQPPPPPTATPDGQRDLTTMMAFFVGNWDSKPGEPPARLRVTEFWKGSPARWVYLEWVRLADESKPTRQLVFRIVEAGPRQMTATVHRLPGDAARFAGEWRKPEPFAAFEPGDLREVAGCRLKGQRPMIAHFAVVTEGNHCPGDMPGFPNMRFEFSITSSELDVLEQPRDAAGNLPAKPLDPFRYSRMSASPK